MSGAATAWRAAIVAAYAARPLSCAVALGREVRPPDNPYASLDPHGFLVMATFVAALACAPPVLWLLLQRRAATAAAPVGVERRRSVAVLLVIGTPMLLQLPFTRLPLAADWPVLASMAAWFALVLFACVDRRPEGPSIHGVFDTYPRAAWAVVGALAASKLAFLVPLLA